MNINNQLVAVILAEIAQLEQEYQHSPGMILSEDDLKCRLFAKIANLIPAAEPTLNKNVLGSALHAEIKFFDEDGLLTLRPDIAVINPEHLSIFHSVEFAVKHDSARFNQFSSKSFEVGETAILIELKFTKNKSGMNDKHILSYEADLKKMKRLQEIVSRRSDGGDKIYGIFAIFNKTNLGNEKFDGLQERYADGENIHLVYGTGNVDFTGVNPDLFGAGYLFDHHQIC